jgi:hypothetical protein
MGFTPDEVMILYQLTRAYIDREQWDKAEKSLQDLLALARASEMMEFVTRGLWLQSKLETHREEHDAALDSLVQASDLAEEIHGRLTQYFIQIQKANVYQRADNDAAARDATIYAQRLQKKLVENYLSDEAAREAFLNNPHSLQLQRVVETANQKVA